MNKYFWNTAAGLLNAAEAVILGMLTTRLAGVEAAGILTIAFSVGNLFSSVGRWGIWAFQVTDGGAYSFREYRRARWLTLTLMVLLATGYTLFQAGQQGYSGEKIAAILLMTGIYAVEIFEETFWGHYQKHDHIETGAQLFIARWMAIILAYGVTLFATRRVDDALGAGAVASVVVLTLLLRITWKPYRGTGDSISAAARAAAEPAPSFFGRTASGRKAAKENRQVNAGKPIARRGETEILRKCFPILVTSFLELYLINAPKFAVDALMSSEAVAAFGFISMPVFMIKLFSSFIYNPKLVAISLDWRERRMDAYRRRNRKILGLIAFLTAAAAALAWLAGIPVLELLYAVELKEYRVSLTILILSGGFMAASAYINYLLIVEGRQKYSVIAYGASALLSLALYRFLIPTRGILGASLGFLAAMGLNALIMLALEIRGVQKFSGHE